MLWPVSGWGGRGCALRRSLLLAGFLAWTPLANAAPNEAPAGTPSASAPADTGSNLKLAGPAGEAYGPEQRAQELYLDAMEKLDAGRLAWAEKTFEALIAQFPQSTAATLARRQLGALYRGRPGGASAGGEVSRVVTPAEPVPAPAVTSSPAWEQELRRNAPIQARLRNEAGDRVFFGSGSAELGSRARAALIAQAQWLNRWHEFEAAIEGHADEPGSEEQNLRLSEARAEAVRRRLVEEGVEPSRLAIVALGRTHRLAICAETDCAAQNRRAVTLVFASGTRERLGLTAAVHVDALEAPARAPGIEPTAVLPPPAEHVGATR
jgi:outer membrane protein OmpA-like peptidoglycan-associated protein